MEETTHKNVTSALIVGALVIVGLIYGRTLLIPLSLAAVLAFVMAPLVEILMRWKAPHGVAVGLVLFAFVSLAFVGSGLFSQQMLMLTGSLSTYKDNFAHKLHAFQDIRENGGDIARASRSIETLLREFERPAPGASQPEDQVHVVVEKDARDNATGMLETVVAGSEPLEMTLLTLLYAAVLLGQKDDIVDRVVRLAGVENLTASTSALSEAGKRLSRYFLMQTAINCAFGVMVGVVLALIGVPHAVLWAMATIVLRYLPFVGVAIAAMPPVLLAAAVDPGWTLTFITLTLFIAGEFLANHFVQPLLLGRQVGLSAFAIIAAGSFWSLVWGPVGLLLSAPLTIILVALGDYVPALKFLNVVFGDKPPLTPDEEFYHRILAEDALGACDRLERASNERSEATAADEILVPAMRLAARDLHEGRLSSATVSQLEVTTDEIEALIAPDAVPATDDADAIFVAAHGVIDKIMAQLAAAVITRATGHKCAAIRQATGLMALSSLRATEGREPATIVLIGVGGAGRPHLKLLVRRAAQTFRKSRLIACDWIGAGPDQEDVAFNAAARCPSLTALEKILRYENAPAAPPSSGTSLAVAS